MAFARPANIASVRGFDPAVMAVALPGNSIASSPPRHRAIATSTDASCRFAANAFHESWAQRADRMGIGNMRGFREIVEIPFIDDDP